jgi:hypothetical protein
MAVVESDRGGGNALVFALMLAIATALVTAVAAITYIAYNRQSDRVEKVQSENTKIEHDHMVIGTKFTEQSARLKAALAAMDRAYGRGFAVGRKAGTLPNAFAQLWVSVRQGYVVPLLIPRELRRARPTVRRTGHGYTIRWAGLALFASDREPLSDWTAKAWPGTRRRVQIGGRTVLRMIGPFGTVYAWRERNKTYAVAALPRSERLVAPFIRTLG